MASTKLTVGSRLSIQVQALNHRFASEERKLSEVEEKLYTESRASKFRGGTLALIQSIPDGWLPLHSTIRINDAGRVYKLRTAHPQPVPVNDDGYANAAGMPKRLLERIRKHAAKRRALEEDRSKVAREIHNALKAFGTLESLLKKWPELAPFTKGIESATGNLPAVPIDQINKALGIAA